MWQEIKTGNERVIVYQLQDYFPEGVSRAGFSCRMFGSRDVDNQTPIWMQRSNPAKLDAIVDHEEIKYRVGVEFYHRNLLEREALAEQQRFLRQGYVLGERPPEDDISFTARNLREIIDNIQLARDSYWLRFLPCQRTQRRGARESRADRPLENKEIELLLPSIRAIIKTLEGVPLREPFSSPAYYLGLVTSLMDKHGLE
ncbi:MAG TPA: hypothetical protein VJI15_04895 [Candidatus Nanoarchaeia archaeon]|nr:hypothetical protein [Candidatus Nanoarchaeia archaeon]